MPHWKRAPRELLRRQRSDGRAVMAAVLQWPASQRHVHQPRRPSMAQHARCDASLDVGVREGGDEERKALDG